MQDICKYLKFIFRCNFVLYLENLVKYNKLPKTLPRILLYYLLLNFAQNTHFVLLYVGAYFLICIRSIDDFQNSSVLKAKYWNTTSMRTWEIQIFVKYFNYNENFCYTSSWNYARNTKCQIDSVWYINILQSRFEKMLNFKILQNLKHSIWKLKHKFPYWGAHQLFANNEFKFTTFIQSINIVLEVFGNIFFGKETFIYLIVSQLWTIRS